MSSDVTMVMPVHPARWKTTMRRALRSVLAQTMPVAAHSIAIDFERRGAGPTRDRALAGVRTEWLMRSPASQSCRRNTAIASLHAPISRSDSKSSSRSISE